MNRPLSVLLGGTLFAAVGLASAYGYASLRLMSVRPDWERFFFIALPAVWAVVGVVIGLWVYPTDDDRRR